MSMQNQTTVPPMPWPNILEDILVVPSSQLYALIITMKKMSHSITIATKTRSLLSKQFRWWNSFSISSNTSRKNTSKQIRYYGLYARTKEQNKNLNPAISREKHKIILSFNRWRDCILHSFRYDPLKCPCCGQTMVFLEIYDNHQHNSLNEMYERVMAKFYASSA